MRNSLCHSLSSRIINQVILLNNNVIEIACTYMHGQQQLRELPFIEASLKEVLDALHFKHFVVPERNIA